MRLFGISYSIMHMEYIGMNMCLITVMFYSFRWNFLCGFTYQSSYKGKQKPAADDFIWKQKWGVVISMSFKRANVPVSKLGNTGWCASFFVRITADMSAPAVTLPSLSARP